MKTPPILKIAVPSPLRKTFDYLPPKHTVETDWLPGSRLRVPFGRGRKIGVLLGTATHSDIPPGKLRHAETLIDGRPLLSPASMRLLHWAADYYHYPIGEVIHGSLPALLRRGDTASVPAEIRWHVSEQGLAGVGGLARAPKQAQLLELLIRAEDPCPDGRFGGGLSGGDLDAAMSNWRGVMRALEKRGFAARQAHAIKAAPPQVREPGGTHDLNPAQREAVAAIGASLGGYHGFLLDGVTGSGKTEVYLGAIERTLQAGRQALVLVPEISLTPQTVRRFEQRLGGNIANLHSGLNDSERLHAWLAAAEGKADVVIGTRSAVFVPLARPGLIVVDEEHDGSFKQQDGFRYHARDVAVMRARQQGLPIVLGSATPSLESLRNVETARYTRLHLPERVGKASHPRLEILDLRRFKLDRGLAPPLILAAREHLARGEQVLLFLNRRGYAPALLCESCDWHAECRRCDAKMTLHGAGDANAELGNPSGARLRCHHCGSEQAPPTACPSCGGRDLRAVGQGTERVDEAVRELFPDTRVLRIDRDTTRRKGSMEGMFEKIRSGEPALLVGTQMLAKGHHFPNVTLVGILGADHGLLGADFRSEERLAQLIVQVAGRAGRADKPGHVLVQTYQPEHPMLRLLLSKGYAAFATQALAQRREAGMPPWSAMALLRAEAAQGGEAQAFLSECAEVLQRAPGPVAVLGPASAPMERRAGRYRWQLMLLAEQRGALHALLKSRLDELETLKQARKVRWSLDIDPADTL